MNIDKSKKFEYLFKSNRKSFWRQVSYFQKKSVLTSSKLNVDKFSEYYANFQLKKCGKD